MVILQTGCISAAVMGGRAIYDHNDVSNTLSTQEIAYDASKTINNDPKLKDVADISVSNYNNLLLLTGTVPSASLKSRAMSLARSTHGVARIYNGITVGPLQSAWAETQDTWLTSKVKTSMVASSGISPSNFKVVTSHGIVYLMGAAPRDQVKKAVQIAKSTDGVKKVVNLMYYVNLSTS